MSLRLTFRSFSRILSRPAVVGAIVAAVSTFGSSSPALATTWTSNTNLRTCTGNTLQDIDVSDNGQVVAAVAQSGYLCVSVNGGSTFTKRGFTSAIREWRSVDVAPDGGHIVAAFYYGPSSGPGGIWWSDDASNFVTWTDITPNDAAPTS